ncbi:hypothetical protein U2F10_34920 [Leptothoe sp. EHU-05/26/07-4]
MALAILRWQDTDDNYAHFDIDIGITNRYYRYHIGDGDIYRVNGLKQLEGPNVVSPLMGPLPPESLGRKTLAIPKEQFGRNHRHIQLFSFRSAQQEGLALSEIVELPIIGLPREHHSSQGGVHPNPRSSVSLSLEVPMPSQPIAQPPVEVVAFAYKETPPLDMALAMGGFSSFISKLIPAAKKVATAVVTNPQAQTALKQAGTFLQNPQNQQLLMNAGTALLSPKGEQGQQALNNQALMQLLMNFLAQSGMVAGASATGAKLAATQPVMAVAAGRSHGSTNGFSTAASASGYSQTLFLPALAALLGEGGAAAGAAGGASSLLGSAGGAANLSGLMTSLMPLLQQVLTPETVQMMLQNISPTKLLGAVTDSVTQVAKVSMEDKKQDQQHIEKLIENVDDTAMEKWAYSSAMVNALTWSPQEIDYRRVARVRLDFMQVTPLMLHGRTRVLYHQGHDIAFPLKLDTPRPIARGILQILVKNPETLEVLIEKTYRVEDLTHGPLTVVPTLSQEQLAMLEPNEDYLVMAVLAWGGRSQRTMGKKRMGTSMTQMITLVRDYCFDRIEGQGETVALNDVDRYRSYWHKVWQGQLSKQRRQLTLDCKYYYSLERDRTTLARMETLTRIEQTSHSHQEGKLKAGMMLNPERLNELLGQISHHAPLNDEQLNALFNRDNIDLFNALARSSVKFRGRRGSTVALWVYPEFKLQRILLKRVSDIDENGHVTELSEAPVYFPMPTKAHFIGVSDE